MHADTDQKLEMENPVHEHLENIVSVLLILEIGVKTSHNNGRKCFPKCASFGTKA